MTEPGYVPDSAVLPPGQPAGEQELDAHEATPDATSENVEFAGDETEEEVFPSDPIIA